MKKTIFILAISLIALSVSACTLNQPNEEAIPLESVTPSGINNSTNNSAAGQSTVAPEVVPVGDKNMINPEKFENLSKVYSQAKIKTTLGDITVKFYASDSPMTVNNFLNLAQAGFYDGTKFHRVIKDFMIQGGDPLSKEANAALWGTGGPGYKFNDEINSHKLVAGSLAMANAGANTNGSQFFIVTATATSWLDGHHTNFGEVVSGMDVVRKIEAVETGVNDRPAEDVMINGVELLK